MADNRILNGTGWQQRIRDKMGIDAAYLLDAAIEQPEVIAVAEANIIAQIPDYESLEGDAKVYLEAAVVCECAVLLCPSMAARLPKKEQGPHETHEVTIDWDKKKSEFAMERDGYVGKILSPSTLPSLFHFGISNPVREWER
jgi:hypothetical protein